MMETTPDTYLDGRSPAYDAVAKKLIATRSILSWILKYCVKEFKDTDLQEIKTHCIIGTPEVAEVPVHPDMTNSLRIRGKTPRKKRCLKVSRHSTSGSKLSLLAAIR